MYSYSVKLIPNPKSLYVFTVFAIILLSIFKSVSRDLLECIDGALRVGPEFHAHKHIRVTSFEINHRFDAIPQRIPHVEFDFN